jgi:hypothetical protein
MVAPMDKAMLTAVAETFENLAFMEALPGDEDAVQTAQDECLQAALLFHEPVQGEIRVAFPRELLTQVAATVFGLPAGECSDSTLHDVSAEILNTIAGRFMNELLPEHQVFRIGLPEIGPAAAGDESEDWREWTFQADGYLFSVCLLNLLPFDLPAGERAAGGCSPC